MTDRAGHATAVSRWRALAGALVLLATSCLVIWSEGGPPTASPAAATELTIQGALQQWLGEAIQVEGVDVQSRESTLRITVRYLVRRNQPRAVAQFSRKV